VTLLQEVTSDINPHRRRLHKKEFHDLCSSPIIIQVINLRTLIWTRHAAGIGIELGAYRVLGG
jgi:hypothetical protein